jgi:hypothetical protein
MSEKKYPERIFVDPERMKNGHPSGELDFDDGEGSVEYIHVDKYLADLEVLEDGMDSAEAELTETAAERDRLKIERDRLLERERHCATQDEAMLRAAVRCMQEVSEVVGLTVQNSPADIAAAVRALGSKRDRLREIVHPLLANAELFNRGTDEDWVALKNKAQAALAETHPYRPDAERDRLRKALETIRNGQHTYAGIRDIADVALAEAPPPRPDAGQVNAELLEALKRVLSWVKNWNPSFCEDDEWIEDNKAFRALITKAEGAQS